ncbi:conserved domain-containing protein [Abditibacterium utsteinense]|uniref:Conserved domain-containing protein n=1 Tax=Abditibacterium utsteinense TaxID=1960156 RepID=A0A2S8SSR6_9BACT|nr:YsnF/AvaK domain-containing protein [Abditibacterium utsteinense]PQV63818.1 conserved domain-containing protein [Abditibacterium utsteinense]
MEEHLLINNSNQNLDPSLAATTNSTYAADTSAAGASNLPRVSREEYNRLDEVGRQRVQLIEEELHVSKEQRELGQVEISKRIVEEQVAVPVTLEREEIVITRHAGSGQDATGQGFTDEVISVPVREEFATVNKTSHVAEEIEIEKRTTQQQTTVGGTVRREELEVEGDPQDRVRIEGDAGNTRNI